MSALHWSHLERSFPYGLMGLSLTGLFTGTEYYDTDTARALGAS